MVDRQKMIQKSGKEGGFFGEAQHRSQHEVVQGMWPLYRYLPEEGFGA